jgi:hypothetical protein
MKQLGSHWKHFLYSLYRGVLLKSGDIIQSGLKSDTVKGHYTKTQMYFFSEYLAAPYATGVAMGAKPWSSESLLSQQFTLYTKDDAAVLQLELLMTVCFVV